VIYISKHNTKLGSIPSISLNPFITCGDLICKEDCYAINIIKHYPHVKHQWTQNYLEYKYNSSLFFQFIYRWIIKSKIKYFRWHVGGECSDIKYLKNVILMAERIKNVRFLLYTKRYDWVDNINIPDNLSIILSMHPYIKEPRTNLPKTFIRGDLRAPKESFICNKLCINCLYCWNKPKNILFKGH